MGRGERRGGGGGVSGQGRETGGVWRGPREERRRVENAAGKRSRRWPQRVRPAGFETRRTSTGHLEVEREGEVGGGPRKVDGGRKEKESLGMRHIRWTRGSVRRVE